jgi:gas vesicle protein
MDNNKSKVLLSLLAGATAGVVAGLLLAPDSGKNSRASLKNSASKWGGDLDKVFRDGLGRLQEMTGKLNGLMGQSGSSEGGEESGADSMFNDFASENKADKGASGKAAGTSPS